MTVQEFLANEKLVADYRQWVNSNIAILVLSIVQETFCRPVLPFDINKDATRSSAEILLGECAGAWKMLDVIRHLDQTQGAPERAVTETYGATAEAPETTGVGNG